MIPVQIIKVCIRLAELPNDLHCVSHKRLVTRFDRLELLAAGKKKAVTPGVSVIRNKKSSVATVDS